MRYKEVVAAGLYVDNTRRGQPELDTQLRDALRDAFHNGADWQRAEYNRLPGERPLKVLEELEAENSRLRAAHEWNVTMVKDLADRVAAQSELLAIKAESSDDVTAMDILRERKLFHLLAVSDDMGSWRWHVQDAGRRGSPETDPARAVIAFAKQFPVGPDRPAKEESKAERAFRIMREMKWDVVMNSGGKWFVNSNTSTTGGLTESIRTVNGDLVLRDTPEDAVLVAYEVRKAANP